jgi:hypothetical protein
MNVQCLLFQNDLVVIAEVIEVMSEIGDPDCKLVKPFRILGRHEAPDMTHEERIQPWLDFTEQSDIMVRSSDILTFVEPAPQLLAHYMTLID